MEKFAKYLDITCAIMDGALNNKKIDLSSYENDTLFIQLMNEQSFLPFLYKVDKTKHWRKYYYQAFIVHEKFENLALEIQNIFNEHKVKHVFLKGHSLKKFYDDPIIRTMGDIDILIKKDDLKIANELMINNGFKVVSTEDYHICYSKNNLFIELHDSLTSKTDKYYSFFKTAIDDNTTQIAKYAYNLDANINIIYLLCHYIKHLKNGAGLRELCDFYLLLTKENIDLTLLNKYLDELNLKEFFNTILNELNIIFSYNEIGFIKNQASLELINFSLHSGIHGFGENNSMSLNQMQSSKQSKFAFLMKKLFIPLPKLFEKYKWTKSIILIPLGYIVRFFHLAKNKKKELSEIVHSEKENKLFEKIGLN